jgi:hypothetical protein
MQKVISVFQRNYDTDRLIRNEVVPGAEWVLAGEGRATRKWDGACCMVREGRLYKRYELKAGKPAPYDFEAAQEADPVTGAIPGWLPVGFGPEDQWFRAAFESLKLDAQVNMLDVYDATYEAVGLHFGGGHHDKNPEGLERDALVIHGVDKLHDCPRDFEGIREYLRDRDIEGIVFINRDGRMAKVKQKDYGLRRGATVLPTKASELSQALGDVSTEPAA